MNRKFTDQNMSYSKITLKIYRRRDLSSPLSEFLSSVVIIAVLWFGGGLVLGDNSAHSLDGRYYGPISEKQIFGRVSRIYWPISRIVK